MIQYFTKKGTGGGGGAVTSVAGKVGAVTLVAADITDAGTSATKDTGTSSGDVVELGATGLPAVSGQDLTGLGSIALHSDVGSLAGAAADQVLAWDGVSSFTVTNQQVTSVAAKTGAVTLNTTDITGLGTAAVADTGTGIGNVPALTATGLPAVSGQDLTGLGSIALHSDVGSLAGAAADQVLAWDGVSSFAVTNQQVTSVASKTGAVTLNSTDITGLGTAAVTDTGTSVGNVPALTATGLPAVSGQDLTALGSIATHSDMGAVGTPNAGDVYAWDGVSSFTVQAQAGGALPISTYSAVSTHVNPAAAGTSYLMDTSAAVGPYTVTLPAAPSTGDQIEVTRVGATHAVNINGNGKNINGAASLLLNADGASTRLRFWGATYEWREMS